jgi:hypothetical protein
MSANQAIGTYAKLRYVVRDMDAGMMMVKIINNAVFGT